MATRATYSFDGSDFEPRTTVYIHWDGYPEFAAIYFYNMLTNPSHGGLATQFIRANEGAEITSGHNAHGDTEYRYSVNLVDGEPVIKAESRNWQQYDSCPNWTTVFHGGLHDFVDTYV